jgi:hypothetical protein
MSIAFLKVFLVFALLVGGAIFLAIGIGVDIPLVKYKEFEAYGIPAGLVLLVAGVALARFWKVSKTETVEETHTETISDDNSTTTQTTKKTTTTTTLARPPV